MVKKRDLNLLPRSFGSSSFWLCKRLLFSAKMHFWTIFITCLHISCGANLLKMVPNAFASIRFGGKAIFFAQRAIIKCLKKRADRHPLFVKAVPAHIQFIYLLGGLSAKRHSHPLAFRPLKTRFNCSCRLYSQLAWLGGFCVKWACQPPPIMAWKQ